MNALLERGMIFLFALTLITQVIIPLFVPKLDLFWIFRKKKPKAPVSTGPTGTLDETIGHLKEEATTHATALKSTLDTVDDSIHKLEDIKHGI